MRFGLISAALSLSIGLASPARAATPVRVDYSAPATCPPADTLLELIRARTPDLVADAEALLVATTTVAQSPGGFVAEIQLRDGRRAF